MYSFLQLKAVGHIQLLLDKVKLKNASERKNSFSLLGITARFSRLSFGMIALSVKITYLKKIFYISLFLNIFLSEDYRDTFHFLLLTNMNLLNL